MKRVVWKVTLLLGVTMAVACAGLAACGDLCLQVLFGGDEYAGYGSVVALLPLSTFLSAISFPVDNGLWVMGRPDLNFRAGLWKTKLRPVRKTATGLPRTRARPEPSEYKHQEPRAGR